MSTSLQMELLCIFIVFGLLTGLDGVQSLSYVISVSSVICSDVPVKVSVTILTESPVSVVSEIVRGDVSLSRAQSTIAGGSTEMQVLPAIHLGSPLDSLMLVVKGYNGTSVVFSDSAILYHPRELILLQTDKFIYKPGQSVKILALVINTECKQRREPVNITIFDPQNNRIHQWLNMSTTLGVMTKEIQLSQNPPLGFWKIVAEVNQVSKEMTFTIIHYVQPKFKVLLNTPAVVYYKDPLNYTVQAQYPYGNPVTGNLTVSLTLSYFYQPSCRKAFAREINGTVHLSLNISALCPEYFSGNNTNQYYRVENILQLIDIKVQVTERLTGVTYNSTMRVFMAMQKYQLQFEQYPFYITPSLNFSAQLRISTYDGQPLTKEDQKHNVTLTLSQQTNELYYRPKNIYFKSEFIDSDIPVKTLHLPVPADGVIPFQFELSPNVTSLSIMAQYKNSTGDLWLYRRYYSKYYMQLRGTSSPQVGQPLSITVESNFPLTKFYYVVIARGQLVTAGTSTSSSFSLTPDVFWAPQARIYVYCISPDNQIVVNFLDVFFTKVLRNNVSLSWKKKQAEPKERTSLSVSVAEPRSLVGILVVEKTSQYLHLLNDITEIRVIQDLSMKFSTNVKVLSDARLEYSYPTFYKRSKRDNYFQEFQEIIRNWDIPETWLWMDINTGESTTSSVEVTVPDMMTTWVAKAFVMSENLGLGISDPVELRVSKAFFMTLNLPAFIIRGEQLLLEVSLFSHMDVDVEVKITVNKNDMFEFVNEKGVASSQVGSSKVTVWKQNTILVSFAIKAIKLGQMNISVEAVGSAVSDSVHQTILVKSEGREESFTQTLLLELSSTTTSLSRQLEFDFPATVVPDSLNAIITAIGDIMGPSISGLNSLIQMPYGCGEQNMINFAPNIYVLWYLSSIGRVDEGTRTKALKYMKEGYERELTYQRSDGSFSAFGQSDSSGSTWLSAFVLRCFLQARGFILINTSVLTETASWLKSQQNPDGSFKEPGRVIHTELQGGLDGPVSLTAYVLMALLEDEQNRNSHEVSSALNYLTSKLDQGIPSDYSLCSVTYALSLANSFSASRALTELMNRARMQDGVPMWSSGGGGLSNSWQPRSADIEMASYVLLSMQKLGKVQQVLSLMKWLGQQRNHIGGYGTTQDTVIALHALSAFASLSSTNQNLKITVTTSTATVATFTIDQTNYMLYQSKEFKPENQLKLQISAVGTGFALFQLTTFYNVLIQEVSRRRRDAQTCQGFHLNVDVTEMDTYSVNNHICFRLCENMDLNQTGMAILDVGLLSGFGLAQRSVPISDLVRNVEVSEGRVILYLDSVNKTEACIEVPTTMEFKAAGVRDAVVTLYDYYEPRRRALMGYTSMSRSSASVCAFCEGDCSQCGSISSTSSSVFSYQHQALVLSLALAFISWVLWF